MEIQVHTECLTKTHLQQKLLLMFPWDWEGPFFRYSSLWGKALKEPGNSF